MSLINSVFITILFSYWVWSLKQDIVNLEDGAHATAGAAPGPAPESDHRDHEHQPGHTGHAHEHAVKARGKGGVPTWEID